MTYPFWSEFTILFIATLIGSAAVMPYSLELLKSAMEKKATKMSLPKIVLLSLLQTAVLFAAVTWLGLLLAHSIGLGAPYIEALIAHSVPPPLAPMLWAAVVIGFSGGLFLSLADFLFLPHLPKPLIDSSRKTSPLQNFAASFYGGINEEILMRLFGLSLIAWILSRVWHTSTGLPTNIVFWFANIAMAVIFGLGHLPATKKITGAITPLLLIRSLILNGIIGIACGWLFVRYGIEAAIIAHFSADIIYHVGGSYVLRLLPE
jgi:hypothetical protein